MDEDCKRMDCLAEDRWIVGSRRVEEVERWTIDRNSWMASGKDNYWSPRFEPRETSSLVAGQSRPVEKVEVFRVVFECCTVVDIQPDPTADELQNNRSQL